MEYDDGWYLDLKLKPILERSYGVLLFQEQVQQICKVMCGWSYGQGDVIRRIIGKKIESEMVPALDKFVQDGISNGNDEDVMVELARQIEAFGRYSFNESHAVGYGYTAYITAYLKAHFPIHFWLGKLNTCLGDTDKTARYVRCAKKDGIEILLPNIEYGDHIWQIKDGKLLMGFMCIKGIKNSFSFGLGDYDCKDLDVFLQYNRELNKKILEGLIKAGCFEGDISENLQRVYKAKLEVSGTKRLREMSFEEYRREFPLPKMDRGTAQLEVLGIAFEDVFGKYDKAIVNGSNIRIGICNSFRPKKDKNGKQMAFMSMNEPNGLNDYVMFWRGYTELTEGICYIFKTNDQKIIQEVTQAKLLTK